MLGKHFRLLFGVSLLFCANTFALTIQSGSSVTYFNTNPVAPPPYVPPPAMFGPYVGVNVGYGWQNGSTSSVLAAPAGDFLVYTPGQLDGLFEQLNIGYVYNDYISVEAGGMHFDDGTYQIVSYGLGNKTNQLGSPANTTVQTYAADLLFKLSLPIKHTKLSLFAAGGGAYERVSFKTDYTNFSNPGNPAADGLFTPRRNMGFMPMFAVGAAYAFTQQLSLLMTYEYLCGSGAISTNYINYFPSAHMLTVGLRWMF